MTVSIAFVMDPIWTINPKKDSTLAMICAALDKQWRVYHVLTTSLNLADGKINSHCQQIQHASFEPDNYYRLGEPETIVLDDIDIIMMRKDPPFDMAYIYTTYLLEQAGRNGALVVNRPSSLRDCNEKLFATQFSEHTPALCVSCDMDSLRAFVQEQGQAILKPLDGMGGSSIFKTSADDPNLSVILETLTAQGTTVIMGQQYLPEIKDGDKRILMIDGEPVPYCLARIPKAGETRGNLAAGGSGRVQALSDNDYAISHAVGPKLKAMGIVFAGLDVIGDYLTEINVTSPTCIREISAATDIPIAANLIATIESKLRSRE